METDLRHGVLHVYRTLMAESKDLHVDSILRDAQPLPDESRQHRVYVLWVRNMH